MDTRTADACIGVVLAGGRSRRMGRDKALLEWRGKTFMDHAIARFHDAGIASVVVSGVRPGHAGIADVRLDTGPLAGLLAVAEAHPGAWLVVVPVDMPLLPATWLSRLAEQRAAAPALHYPGAPLPLAFVADPATIASLRARLLDPAAPRSLHAWLAHIGASTPSPPPGPADALQNLNTPADWEALHP